VGKSSVALNKILEKIDTKIKIAFGNVNVLRGLVFSRVKDQTPAKKRSDWIVLVYMWGRLNNSWKNE